MHVRFASPPRRVPMTLIVTNLFNALSQIGWALLGFGGIFFWVFAMNADFSFVTFRGEMNRIAGEVLQIEKTNASEGGSKNSPGTPVYRTHYAYSVAGQRLTGTSYSTGHHPEVGQQVDVEYIKGKPAESRIQGMRRKLFGAGAGFVVIFPLVGLGLAWGGLRLGLKRNHLLRDGLVAMGTLVDKRATATQVNKQTVYELTFEFTARDGQRHRAKVRSHQPQRLEDEAQEPLLYDPANPGKAYLLDEAPSRPVIDPNGELEGRGNRALLALILPAIVIIGHGLAALVHFK
jgi:hypothetical protein